MPSGLFGIEAGDPEIQKLIQKNIDFEKAKEVVRMTQAAGIDARCSFMFGNQNETPKTLQRTIDLAKELRPDFAFFNIATPTLGPGFATGLSSMDIWRTMTTQPWIAPRISLKRPTCPGVPSRNIARRHFARSTTRPHISSDD